MRNKNLSSEAAESKHQAAIRGLENLGLFDKADEIASLDPIEYVESKGYQVQNPTQTTQRRTQKMTQTRAELLAENQELREENERLADIVDSVASLVSTDEDDYEDEEEDDE